MRRSRSTTRQSRIASSRLECTELLTGNRGSLHQRRTSEEVGLQQTCGVTRLIAPVYRGLTGHVDIGGPSPQDVLGMLTVSAVVIGMIPPAAPVLGELLGLAALPTKSGVHDRPPLTTTTVLKALLPTGPKPEFRLQYRYHFRSAFEHLRHDEPVFYTLSLDLDHLSIRNTLDWARDSLSRPLTACVASVVARRVRAVAAQLALDSLAVVFLVWRTLASQSRCLACCVAPLVERCNTYLWLLSAWCWLVVSSSEVLLEFFSVGSGLFRAHFCCCGATSGFEVCCWLGWCVLEGFSQNDALVVLVEVLPGPACVASTVLLATVFSLMVCVLWSWGLCILVKVLPRIALCRFWQRFFPGVLCVRSPQSCFVLFWLSLLSLSLCEDELSLFPVGVSLLQSSWALSVKVLCPWPCVWLLHWPACLVVRFQVFSAVLTDFVCPCGLGGLLCSCAQRALADGGLVSVVVLDWLCFIWKCQSRVVVLPLACGRDSCVSPSSTFRRLLGVVVLHYGVMLPECASLRPSGGVTFPGVAFWVELFAPLVPLFLYGTVVMRNQGSPMGPGKSDEHPLYEELTVVMRNQGSPMGPGKSDEHPLYEELTAGADVACCALSGLRFLVCGFRTVCSCSSVSVLCRLEPWCIVLYLGWLMVLVIALCVVPCVLIVSFVRCFTNLLSVGGVELSAPGKLCVGLCLVVVLIPLWSGCFALSRSRWRSLLSVHLVTVRPIGLLVLDHVVCRHCEVLGFGLTSDVFHAFIAVYHVVERVTPSFCGSACVWCPCPTTRKVWVRPSGDNGCRFRMLKVLRVCLLSLLYHEEGLSEA
ncbi:hypothetical protein Taro_030025 [Colocasia esculenta]|uniref:Uncharacterized protein n=1 Tax=Colocasia esculenta TaxID=4460 RepID=A0A843VWN3_COLES|nr:hypothetical protein [Colocasia esculenta]